MSDNKTTDLTEQVAQTIYEQWFEYWPPSHPVDLGMDAASFREVAAKVVKLVQDYTEGSTDQTDTDLPVHLAAARGRQEHAEGWTLDECPYPDEGPMRSAWINAWINTQAAKERDAAFQ